MVLIGVRCSDGEGEGREGVGSREYDEAKGENRERVRGKQGTMGKDRGIYKEKQTRDRDKARGKRHTPRARGHMERIEHHILQDQQPPSKPIAAALSPPPPPASTLSRTPAPSLHPLHPSRHGIEGHK